MQIYTNTDYCLVAFCTWIPSTRECKELDGQVSAWCYVHEQCPSAKRSSRESASGAPLFWLKCDETTASVAALKKKKAAAEYERKKQELKQLLAQDKVSGLQVQPVQTVQTVF
jgi:hypothetical protein